MKVNGTKSFTYVSHSIKEFFDNVQKVPEKLMNNSAFHLCMDPQVQWIVHDKKVATVHEHPDLFKAQHGSGPDALVKEIIANVTHSYVNDVYLFVGEPISAGYEQCDTARFDWEQDKQMHNLSDVHSGYGTADTKQWLKVNNRDNITKLSMTCTRVFSAASGKRPLPDEKDADDAGMALFSNHLPVQVLLALFVAALIVSCA